MLSRIFLPLSKLNTEPDTIKPVRRGEYLDLRKVPYLTGAFSLEDEFNSLDKKEST